MPKQNVIEFFRARTQMHPNKPALHVERNDEVVVWTWREWFGDTMQCAKAMIHVGLSRFAGVCCIGFNSPEWLIADLAAIAAGGIAAGIYTTNAPDACQYVMDHCRCEIIFVENRKQLDKVRWWHLAWVKAGGEWWGGAEFYCDE